MASSASLVLLGSWLAWRASGPGRGVDALSAAQCDELLASAPPATLPTAPRPGDVATEWIEFLAHPALGGRRAGTDGGRQTAAALLRHLKALGLSGVGPSLCRSFPLLGGTETNLVAVLPAAAPSADVPPRWLLGAHYDGQGRHPTRGSLPGADDNASGVAAVLEVAERLVARPQHAVDVVIVLFAAEEVGQVGSRSLRVPVDAAVILDMVGRPLPMGDPARLAFRSSDPGLSEALARAAADVGVSLVRMDRLGRFRPGLGDDLPLAASGIGAALISSGLHADHHELGDTPDRIDREQVLRAADVVEAWIRAGGSVERAATHVGSRIRG